MHASINRCRFRCSVISSVLALVFAGNAGAMSPSGGGCSLLADVVEHSFQQAIRRQAGDSRSAVVAIAGLDNVVVCATTAATVSRAFSEAVRGAGIDIRWTDVPLNPDNFCLSDFVGQCYPRLARIPFEGKAIDTALVQIAWYTVTDSLRPYMPSDAESDFAYFRPGQLADTLVRALKIKLRTPRGRVVREIGASTYLN